MSPNEVRETLTAAVLAAVSILPSPPEVEWDNRINLDMSTQDDLFVRCEVTFNFGIQVTLGTPRVDRYRGALAILVCTKAGEGSAKSLETAWTISKALQCRTWGSLTTETCTPQRAVVDRGWYVTPILVPFSFDDIVVT